MKSNSKTTDRFQVDVVRGGSSNHASAMRGLWSWVCHAPLVILDVAKAKHLLNQAGVQLSIDAGWVWSSQLPALQTMPTWKEFETLLSGGEVRWAEDYSNMIVNEGLDDMLDKFFKGSSYTAAHYVGLTDGTPTVAAIDTMSSHTGWAEVVAYSEGARQTFTPGTVASQSVDNSASKAVFSINGTATVGGGFLSTNSTKSGTSGTLIAAGAFTGGNKSVGSGDSLSITATFTQADDGV